MAVDYYSLLTKAVAGKDAATRDQVYRDASSLIARSQLPREAAASHAAALEDAVRRIEDEIAAEEASAAAAISETLSTGRNWKPYVTGAFAVAAVIALAAVAYVFVAAKGPAIVAANVKSSSPKAQAARQDVVVADLKPGVDGGSSGEVLPFALQRQVVFYRTTVVPGSIVVDRENRFLYLIDSSTSARRYGIGVAQECLKSGSSVARHEQARMAGLAVCQCERKGRRRVARGGRPSRQSARRPRAAARQARAAHPRHQLTQDHRPPGRVRMHPARQRRRRGSLSARIGGNARRLCQLLAGLYLPNTRSISQPSSPAAGSGRADGLGGGAEARVGGGRYELPGGGASGAAR